MPLTQMGFEIAAFWVRMYNLPLVCMGREVGYKLGGTVGVVEEVDINEDGVGWGEFLQVRIKVNLHKPLAQGRMHRIKDRPSWIAFQYKRIPHFCFRCGLIKHGESGCPVGSARHLHGGDMTTEYGLWLCTPLSKRCVERGRERKDGDWRSPGEHMRHWRVSGENWRRGWSKGTDNKCDSRDGSQSFGDSLNRVLQSNILVHVKKSFPYVTDDIHYGVADK
jgi:hypothetical protein